MLVFFKTNYYIAHTLIILTHTIINTWDTGQVSHELASTIISKLPYLTRSKYSSAVAGALPWSSSRSLLIPGRPIGKATGRSSSITLFQFFLRFQNNCASLVIRRYYHLASNGSTVQGVNPNPLFSL